MVVSRDAQRLRLQRGDGRGGRGRQARTGLARQRPPGAEGARSTPRRPALPAARFGQPWQPPAPVSPAGHARRDDRAPVRLRQGAEDVPRTHGSAGRGRAGTPAITQLTTARCDSVSARLGSVVGSPAAPTRIASSMIRHASGGPASRTPRSAVLELLVDLEEVLDLAQAVGGEVLERAGLVPPRVVGGDGQDLVVVALVVAHVERADRARADDASGKVGSLITTSTSSGSPSSARLPSMKP